MILLEGQRCRVREWAKADAEALTEHANNINVARNLRDRFPHPYTLKDARAFLRHAVAANDPTNLAIEADGAAVGAIGYVPGRDVERFSAEIGYWLGESLWGRGIRTRITGLRRERARPGDLHEGGDAGRAHRPRGRLRPGEPRRRAGSAHGPSRLTQAGFTRANMY